MRQPRDSTALALAATFVVAACGSTEVEGPALWLGAAPHLVASGLLDGEALAVDVSGAAAEDLAVVWCERNYEVPLAGDEPVWSEGHLEEFEIKAWVELANVRRQLEVEFKRFDFQRAAPGTAIAIVPNDAAHTPAAPQMLLEWEWHDTEDVELFEAGAESGVFTLAAFEGTPDSSGLVIPDGEGWVGGFVEASWSQTETVRLSFSAKCAESEVDMIE